MTPWFERWPELLEWELERFGQRGIPVRIDEERRAEGKLVLHCETSLGSEPVATEVRYPSEYPELPPLIFGPPGMLDRHQHRFGGNFCLLPRPLDDWPAHDWGAADLLAERLTALFQDTEAGPEAVAAGEAPMPEPVSTYYATANDATVLIAPEVAPIGECGTLRVRRCAPHLFLVTGNGETKLDGELNKFFGTGEEIKATWLRLEAAPAAGPGGAEVARWLRDEHPGVLAPPLPPKLTAKRRGGAGGATLELCCLVFPEEGPGVGETRDGHLFLMIERGPQGKRESLLAAQPLSAAEYALRAPELSGLGDLRALVIGAGTLGGDVSVELAKAGLDVEVIDYDTYELGNMVRHRLGVEAVGKRKARSVADAARRANPFCETKATELQLGAVEWMAQSPLAELGAAVAAADIVVEVSGSHQIAQLVGRVCSEHVKPMVSAWMSEGFYGAEIVRIAPGKTICWTCFASAQQESELLVAEEGPPGRVAAQGCSHPTTAGAGFDALEAVAVAVRLVVQTLEPEGGYPGCEWDHAVLNFRRSPSDSEHPRFGAEALPLPGRDDCDQCRASAGSDAALSKTS